MWLRTLRDVWFPPVCAHCRRLVDAPGRRHLCAHCASQLLRVEGPHCPTCGYPFFGDTEVDRECEHCSTLDPEFFQGRTVVLLRGPARTLVLDIKYHGALHLFEEIELIVRETVGFLDYLRGAVLVPVPLHPRKQRERGYNQSRLLAATFARAAGGGTTVAEPLRRVVDTPTQTRLDRRTRQRNLKNAFALVPGRPIDPAQRLVLVDDVFTTGSTLNACAAVLRRAGHLNLDVATFGHG
ncbi:MAG: ComF family protein [Opitutaceae bacterium]|nr:ComF family protein [Opitutaceae bacterium]